MKENNNQKIVIWAFVKAEDMRPLLNFNKDILVVNLKQKIKINPLEYPKGIPFVYWASLIVDLWQAFRVWEGTKGFLLKSIVELYEKFEGTLPLEYPCFECLNDHINSKKPAKKSSQRDMAYISGIQTRIDALTAGPLGKIFDCSKSHLGNLINTNTIFEIPFLTSEQYIFFINLLLTYLSTYKMANPSNLRHWVAIDDANVIFDSSFERRADLGLPIINSLCSEIGKYGINLFALSQVPSQMGSSIKSNSSIRIIFSLADGKDRHAMNQSVGIYDQEQIDESSKIKIEDRTIIVKFSHRYNKPFTAKLPDVLDIPGLHEKISDDFVYENNQRILSGFEATPRFNINKGDKKQFPLDFQKQTKETKKEPEETKVSDKEKDFMMATNLNQYQKTLTEIYVFAGYPPNSGTANRIAKECVKKNLVKIIKPSFGRKKYPVLLPEAYKILGIDEKKFYGKGAGYEHVLYQHLIAEHFKDYRPILELFRNGKHIDVAIETNELLLGIEVEMTSTHARENIEKDFSKAKIDFMIVACLNEKVRNKVLEIVSDVSIPDRVRNKISVNLISEVLKLNPDEVIDDLK